MDAFWAAPPISRTITAAVALTSASIHFFGLIGGASVAFVPSWTFGKFPPELWRLVTSFLVTGPGLGVILDPYFLYTMTHMLEMNSPRFGRKGDLFTYFVFVGGVIVLLAGIGLGGVFFLECLILALTHTAAQDQPNSRINFFVFHIQMKWAPYAMLLLTFATRGPNDALLQSMGIPASHLYDFLTRIWPDFGGRGAANLLPTPLFVSNWFGDFDGAPRDRQYGTAITPRAPGTAPPVNNSSSSSGGGGGSWTSGSSWGGRGQGRRLGGD